MSQDNKNFIEIYSSYTLSSPAYISNRLTFILKYRKVLSRLKKHGIKMGVKFDLCGIPYINFISRCENKLNKKDFFNRINFGNYNTVYSINQHYPLQSDIVRISIIKTSENKIGKVIIGDNVCLPGTSIISYEKVEIENNVLLGPLVTILDCDGHTIKNRKHPTEVERLRTAPVLIKEGAWIGQGASILKGVTIGKNSVVGINSVVHKSVPDNTVVAGNPAKIIKEIK